MGFELMTTAILPAAIPDELIAWRPACDLFDTLAVPCGNSATHALITHGGCRVRLTCGPCYEQFVPIFTDWLANRPEAHAIVCSGCRARLANPWSALHLEQI